MTIIQIETSADLPIEEVMDAICSRIPKLHHVAYEEGIGTAGFDFGNDVMVLMSYPGDRPSLIALQNFYEEAQIQYWLSSAKDPPTDFSEPGR